jgi:hypothetical protein
VLCEWIVKVEVKMRSVDAAVDVRGKAGLGMVSDGGQRSIRMADLAPITKCLTLLDRPAAKSIKIPS